MQGPLDREVGQCSALVIDGTTRSRSSLVAMLRNFGYGEVLQSSRAVDARRLIEHQQFDLIVCEYHFEQNSMTGQDLVDDLRLAQVLPLKTVVVMISSEAAYANVAEAAEAALDAYLLKPHTEEALRVRVARARQGKRAMRDIFELVERGEHERAARRCQEHVDARSVDWVQAARIGAELWLRVGVPHAAEQLFQQILAIRALPWARLGIARSEYEAGSVRQARRTLESLLVDQPGYADAYDVMSRVLIESGEIELALGSLRRASSLAPNCVSRLQKLGLLAFYHGDQDEAFEALHRASVLGLNSRSFDLQGIVLLASLQFDRANNRGLVQSHSAIRHARADQSGSARLRRFDMIIGTFVLLLQRSVPEAVLQVQQAIAEIRQPDFDFEAACNLLMLLSRLVHREVRLDSLHEHLEAIAARFAASRSTCEMLCRAAGGRSEFDGPLRQGYEAICTQAERAVSQTLKGRPQDAVLMLLSSSEASLSSKLLDLALHTLEQHGEAIPDHVALKLRAQAMNHTYRSYGTQVRLAPVAVDARVSASHRAR